MFVTLYLHFKVFLIEKTICILELFLTLQKAAFLLCRNPNFKNHTLSKLQESIIRNLLKYFNKNVYCSKHYFTYKLHRAHLIRNDFLKACLEGEIQIRSSDVLVIFELPLSGEQSELDSETALLKKKLKKNLYIY